MKTFAAQLVAKKSFEHTIIGLILINAAILGMQTSPFLVARYGFYMDACNGLIISVFVLEAALKITAIAPRWRLYFANGWNLFDFSVVVLSLLPDAGSMAMLARLARLLRVLRLISAVPQLRLIVSTLMRSIPSMGHVLLLMSVIFYVYAIAGYHLFHEHDPQYWGSLGISLLTLFRVVTLEDWTDLMYTAMQMSPFAWIYFVSFVIMGTFVIINLFIAVVLNNLDDAKQQQLKDLRKPETQDELLQQLAKTRAMLDRLQEQLENKR